MSKQLRIYDENTIQHKLYLNIHKNQSLEFVKKKIRSIFKIK